MTTEAFTRSDPYTVSGTGPYNVAHEYLSGAIFAWIELADGSVTNLEADVDFTMSPDAGDSGDLTLSHDAATLHDGLTLMIDRATQIEQGFNGITAREVGLEAELDRLTQGLQEVTDRSRRSLTVTGGAMAPYSPHDGYVPIWDAATRRFVNGPSVDEISNAQEAAEQAVAAQEAAAGVVNTIGFKFATVAEMQASNDLAGGLIVSTRGYQYAGDGGQSVYQVMTATDYAALAISPSTPDGYLDHALAKGLVARLMHVGHIRAEQAGVVLTPLGVAQEKSAAWQTAFYRVADLSRTTRQGNESSVSFTCETDFLTDKVLHMTRSGGGTCEVNVRHPGKITATGGGELEGQFDLTIDAHDRSDRKLRDPRNDVIYGGSEIVSPADLRPLPLINSRIQRGEVYMGSVDCMFWCSGFRYQSCTSTNFHIEEVWNHRTYGHLAVHASNGAMKIHECVTKQWGLNDDGLAYGNRVHAGGSVNMANYTGDCQVSAHKDWMVIGGFWGWSRTASLLLDQTPDENDPAGTGTPGRDCYWDGLAPGSSGKLSGYLTASQGTGDNVHLYTHVMQGYGNNSAEPRYDRISEGGPVSIECWNRTNVALFLGVDVDASTIQLYGSGIRFKECSYITGGTNRFPAMDGAGNVVSEGDRVITIDPRIRVYADGTSKPGALAIEGLPNVSIGFYPLAGRPDFDGDFTNWNANNRNEAGTFNGFCSVAQVPFIALNSATRGFLGLDATNCGIGLDGTASEGDQFLVVEDGDYGSSTTNACTRGQIVTALVDNPGADWGANWAASNYNAVPTRQNSSTAEVAENRQRIYPSNSDIPYETISSPGGALGRTADVTGDGWTENFDGTKVTDTGSKPGFTRRVEGNIELTGAIKSGDGIGELRFVERAVANFELLLDNSSGDEPGNPNTVLLRKTGDDRYASASNFMSGLGDPEGIVTAEPGSFYVKGDAGAYGGLFVKQSGLGNTGWTLFRDGFDTRQQFKDWQALGHTVPTGHIVMAQGLLYVYAPAAGKIPDMVDWMPTGRVYADHCADDDETDWAVAIIAGAHIYGTGGGSHDTPAHTLYFKAHDYPNSGIAGLRDGVSFEGENRQGTRLLYLNSTGNHVQFGNLSSLYHRGGLSKMTLTMAPDAGSPTGYVEMTSGYHLVLNRVRIGSFHDFDIERWHGGIQMVGCAQVNVYDSWILNRTNGRVGKAGRAISQEFWWDGGYDTSVPPVKTGEKCNNIKYWAIDCKTGGADMAERFIWMNSSDGTFFTSCHGNNCNKIVEFATSADLPPIGGIEAVGCYWDESDENSIYVSGTGELRNIHIGSGYMRAAGEIALLVASGVKVEDFSLVGSAIENAQKLAINWLSTTGSGIQISANRISDNMLDAAATTDVFFDCDGLTYNANNHKGGKAAGTCVILGANSQNAVVGPLNLKKSACGTDYADSGTGNTIYKQAANVAAPTATNMRDAMVECGWMKAS